MAVDPAHLLAAALPELRAHPVPLRVRAYAGDRLVVDSTRAQVVWEPRRVVPSYAVPVEDVHATLHEYAGPAADEHAVRMGAGGPPVLDPRTPFTAHSCPGRALTLTVGETALTGAGFAPDDPELDGYVVLDWDAFSQWREEEDVVLGHPHDPFDRIDCRRSSRHVVVSVDGTVLAESREAVLLTETPLPLRFYFPREHVNQETLVPTDSTSVCAYKGHASYWSAHLDGQVLRDVAWSYADPLHDAVPVAGMVAFFTERLDLSLDGRTVERPVTPWS
jgi:uncharacterized protein (DUF427 family)